MIYWLHRGHLRPLLDKQEVRSDRDLPKVSIISRLVEFFIQAEKLLLPDQVKIGSS
jgi:hypothetical protein